MMEMAGRSALACVAALALGACGAGEDPAVETAAGEGYIQAHTIQQLMADVVQPTADVYWGSAGWVVDEAGERDLTPTTDEGWLATRTSAATLTELGNLLMTPLYADGRGEDWMDFARGMVEVGMRAEQAAVDRDSDAVFEVGGHMYNVCSGCHANYPSTAEMEGEVPPEEIRPTGDVSLEEFTEEPRE